MKAEFVSLAICVHETVQVGFQSPSSVYFAHLWQCLIQYLAKQSPELFQYIEGFDYLDALKDAERFFKAIYPDGMLDSAWDLKECDLNDKISLGLFTKSIVCSRHMWLTGNGKRNHSKIVAYLQSQYWDYEFDLYK